jgi:hypothetical protein
VSFINFGYVFFEDKNEISIPQEEIYIFLSRKLFFVIFGIKSTQLLLSKVFFTGEENGIG